MQVGTVRQLAGAVVGAVALDQLRFEVQGTIPGKAWRLVLCDRGSGGQLWLGSERNPAEPREFATVEAALRQAQAISVMCGMRADSRPLETDRAILPIEVLLW